MKEEKNTKNNENDNADYHFNHTSSSTRRAAAQTSPQRALSFDKALRQHVLAHREKDDSKVYPVSLFREEQSIPEVLGGSRT
eukprot:578311-Amphidinium_carterae.1